MAVEAIGKFYGLQVMKKWERDEARAKARVQQYASRAPVPYAPVILTDEEQVAFDELIGDYEEEETAVSEEDGGEGEPNGLEEGNELAVGAAAALEETTEEKMAEMEMEKNGADSAVGAATSEPGVGAAAVVEMKGKGKGSVADTATEGTQAKKPARTQKEKEKKEVRYHCTKPFERVLNPPHSKRCRHQELPLGFYSVERSWIASGLDRLRYQFRSTGPCWIKPFGEAAFFFMTLIPLEALLVLDSDSE